MRQRRSADSGRWGISKTGRATVARDRGLPPRAMERASLSPWGNGMELPQGGKKQDVHVQQGALGQEHGWCGGEVHRIPDTAGVAFSTWTCPRTRERYN